MVHAMEIHGPESMKGFYEEQHVNDLPIPFVPTCTSYDTVVSDTYSDAYNCLTYTDEDVLAADQQRSGLLVQQPRVDLVSGGAEELANSLLNTHRDYRLAVLSTVSQSVQNLDPQCNVVETLSNYSTRNNNTSIVVSTPSEAWQIHSGANTPVVTSGLVSVNIGNAIGQAGTILGVDTGNGTAVGSVGLSSVNSSSHQHHIHHHHSSHHHNHQQQQQQISGGSSHTRGSSSSSSGSTSSGSATKPKRRRVQTSAQRKAANVRERRRMFHLNEAFDELRKRLPAFNYEKRLSRIETLRLAMTYIGFMKEVTIGKDPCNIELQKYKKIGSLDGCDLDDDDDDDDEHSIEDTHRKSHKRQKKIGLYSKDKQGLKVFENI